MTGFWLASFVVLWILVLSLAFLFAGTLRQVGLITLRLGDDPGALITDSGLSRGALTADITGIDADSGHLRTIDSVVDRARVLTFVSPACLACRQLIPHLNEVMQTRNDGFDFVTVCRGDVASCKALRTRDRLQGTLIIDTEGTIEEEFDVRLTPFVYVLNGQGQVLVRGVANEWRHLESLLNEEGTLQTTEWTLAEEAVT